MQTSVSAGGLGAARQVSYRRQTGLLTRRALTSTEAGVPPIRGIPFIASSGTGGGKHRGIEITGLQTGLDISTAGCFS